MAVIFVTHDLGVAAEIADEVAVMYAGRIVEYGPVRQVLKVAGPPLHSRVDECHGSSRHERTGFVPHPRPTPRLRHVCPQGAASRHAVRRCMSVVRRPSPQFITCRRRTRRVASYWRRYRARLAVPTPACIFRGQVRGRLPVPCVRRWHDHASRPGCYHHRRVSRTGLLAKSCPSGALAPSCLEAGSSIGAGRP